MQQVTDTQRTLGRMLQSVGKRIETGECGLSESEISALTEVIATKELSMEQTADYLNIDRSTLSRKIHDEQLPAPRKEKGRNKFYFLKDLMFWNKRR